MTLFETVLVGGLVFLGLLCPLVQLWRTTRQQLAQSRTHEKTLQARLQAIDHQLALVGQAVLPISMAFQAVLVKELIHYHTPRVDELLRKLGPPFQLTEPEEVELVAALQRQEDVMGAQITDAERDAARILPLVMKRAKIEAQVFVATPLIFRLITVVAPSLMEQDQAMPLHRLLTLSQEES
jgi:hypothetical protein